MDKKYVAYFIFAIFLFLIFTLYGCSGLKVPSKSDRFWVLPKWEKRLKADDKIWSSLRSQNDLGTRKITLSDVIGIALKNNPSVRKTMHEARRAHAQLRQAESAWFPQLTFTGDFTKDKRVANEKASDLNTRSYGGTIEADVLAADFGGRWAEREEAHNVLLAANFAFNQVVQDVILEAERAYYELYSAIAGQEAALKSAEDAKAAFELADQKLKVGVASRLEMLQAKANYESSLFTLEEARGNVSDTKADLAEVMGFPADTEFEISDPLWDTSSSLTETDVSELIDVAMKKRPDIMASRANVLSKKASVVSARSDLLPYLSVGGALVKDWTEYFGDNKSYKHYYEYTGFLKVVWNVFDGFSNYAKLKEADAEADAELHQLKEDELQASSDVWKKYYAYKTATRKLGFSETILQSSEESYQLAFEAYKAKLKSMLDLLQAQSQLADARSKLVQSKKDVFIALVELAHATGSLGLDGRPE